MLALAPFAFIIPLPLPLRHVYSWFLDSGKNIMAITDSSLPIKGDPQISMNEYNSNIGIKRAYFPTDSLLYLMQ